jgi:hypothetical protein
MDVNIAVTVMEALCLHISKDETFAMTVKVMPEMKLTFNPAPQHLVFGWMDLGRLLETRKG